MQTWKFRSYAQFRMRKWQFIFQNMRMSGRICKKTGPVRLEGQLSRANVVEWRKWYGHGGAFKERFHKILVLKLIQYIWNIFCVLIRLFSRNTPTDKSKCQVSFDDLVEIFNQVGIYAANQNWKQNFWDTEKFLKETRPHYVKWQGAWKNSIKYYTPHTKPAYNDVPVEGLIEKWNTKLSRGVSQIKTIPI